MGKVQSENVFPLSIPENLPFFCHGLYETYKDRHKKSIFFL